LSPTFTVSRRPGMSSSIMQRWLPDRVAEEALSLPNPSTLKGNKISLPYDMISSMLADLQHGNPLV
jgi:hypothetical protein